jgi:hypothetical protein
MVRLQNPFTHSLENHTNASYHKALFSVLFAQLHSSQRHADGIEGLIALLQDVPLIGVALQRHANPSDYLNIWKELEGDSGHLAHQVSSLSSVQAASLHFTRSQRLRVLKEVGLVRVGYDEEDKEIVPVASAADWTGEHEEVRFDTAFNCCSPIEDSALGSTPFLNCCSPFNVKAACMVLHCHNCYVAPSMQT